MVENMEEFRVVQNKKLPTPHLEEIDKPENKFSLRDDFKTVRCLAW
jgi:hypothetical protein